MSFANEIEEKNVEKINLTLHCANSEARDENGSVIARGTCCKDIPSGTPLWQEVVIIVSLRECADRARDRSLDISPN